MFIMPKAPDGTKYSKKYAEEAISKALEDILNNGMSKKAAAKKYNIPRSTLQFRMSNKFNKPTLGPNPVLTQEEEKILVDWVIQSHRKGFPRRKEDLQISVKTFLDQEPRSNPFKDNLPGDGWYKLFLKRHPVLCERVPEAVTAASAQVTEADIRNWFLQIQTYLEEENYFDILKHPDRVFNADETCFLLCPKNKTVLAPKGARNVYEIDNAPAKSNLTVLFTFSAAGETTPPFIIYPYKRLPSSIAASVPSEWGIGTSPNGWMKTELFFEYIANVFHPYLVKKGTKFPIALFVDGHCTHMSYQLSNLCSELQIILICLYANSTRILQPADVSAFKPLKNYWKRAVLDWRRQNNAEALTPDKFGKVLKIVIDTYLKADCVINGFVATGLCPWNPDAIDFSKCLGKMRNPKTCNHDVKDGSSNIAYSKFAEIVGEDLLNKFRDIKRISRNEPLEFWKLYKLWNEFSTKDPNSNNESVISTYANKEAEHEPPIILEIDKDILVNETDGEIFDIAKMPIIFNNFIDNEEQFAEAESTLFFSDVSVSDRIPTAIETEEFVTTVEQTISITEGSPSQNINISGNSIGKYLVWPESPLRKGKRNTERMPFVLTSEKWQLLQSEKRDKKVNEEKEKEERKRKRLERIEETKTKNSIKKKCSDPGLNSKTKNKKQTTKSKRESNECNKVGVKENVDPSQEEIINDVSNLKTLQEKDIDKKELTTEKKKINIISNLQIKNAAESVKRKIFGDIWMGEINSVTNSTCKMEGIKINEGLCFTCVSNIKKGFKCQFCSRTYHENCIIKHGLFDPLVDTQFICQTCKKKQC